MGRLLTLLALRVGQSIRVRRKNLRLTQKAFAAGVGVTENYLGLVERGARTPSLDLLVTLSKLLGCKARELVPSWIDKPTSSNSSPQFAFERPRRG